MFLLGAAAAGVLAGRLTSGVKAAHSDSGTSGNGVHGYRGQTNYVDPTPTYSDTTSTYTGTATGAAYPAAGSAPLPAAALRHRAPRGQHG